MSDLKFEVGMITNDQEIDRSIKSLQDKLKRLKQDSGTEMSPQARQQNEIQTRAFSAIQQRDIEKQTMLYKELYRDQTNAATRHQAALSKEKQDVMEIAKYRRELLELQEKEAAVVNRLRQSGVSVAGGGVVGGGGFGGASGDEPARQTALGMIGNFLKGAAASAIIKGAFNLAANMVTAEGRGNIAESSAIQSGARPLREAMSGRGGDQYYYASERLKAFEIAQKQNERERTMDPAKGAIGAAAGGITGAGVGFGAGVGVAGLAGMALAPFTGGLSLAVTAGLLAAGGLAGGAIGAYAGGQAGASAMGGERGRQAIFDPDNYKKLMSAKGMKDFEQQMAAEEAKDPLKSAAMDFARNKSGQLLETQRATGLGDRETMDLLLRNMQFGSRTDRVLKDPNAPSDGTLRESDLQYRETQGKYSMQEIMAQQSAMISAGASTEDLRGDLAGKAASAQQYGIRNAAGIMGRISAAGGEGQTDDKFYRLMAKAVETGVIDSNMPQELNRFASMAVEIATKGGGFSTEAIDSFSAGLFDSSKAAMEGAKSAQEIMESMGSETTGIRGQIGLGMIFGKTADYLGQEAADAIKANPAIAEQLNAMSADQLKDDRLIGGIAQQLGVEPEALREYVKQLNLKKSTYLEKSEEKLAAFGEKLSKFDESLVLSPEEREKQQKELEISYAVASQALTTEAIGLKLPYNVKRSLVEAMATKAYSGEMGDFSEEAKRQIEKLQQPKDTGLEATRQEGAAADITNLKNLQEKFGDVTTSIRTFNENFDQTALKFQTFTSIMKEAGDGMDAFGQAIFKSLFGKDTPKPERPSYFGDNNSKYESGGFGFEKVLKVKPNSSNQN
jgi:hypothetical protein